MLLGVYDNSFREQTLDETLDHAVALGLEAIEVGTGAYASGGHCDAEALLSDASARKAFKRKFDERGLTISALSQHGNPLSPDARFAEECHDLWLTTARLASELEVPVVNAFSGCPGDSEAAQYPNWVTCSWPPEYAQILEWQWNEKALPYWIEQGRFAESLGVRIAIEMHPGFLVYNPESLLRLRRAVGPALGANFDPSHLFWQGIDSVEAIRELGRNDAIFHVHAKDTFLDRSNIARNGVLDTKPYTEVVDRAWTFRTVGYGAGEQVWRDIVSMLRTVGYDYVLSIEHEDALASFDEGLKKAVTFLNSAMLHEPPLDDVWWA